MVGCDCALFEHSIDFELGVETLALLEIKDLTYFYPGSTKPSLNSIDLDIREGEFLLVVGGSGSGKSSLARVIAGLIPEFRQAAGQTFQGMSWR